MVQILTLYQASSCSECTSGNYKQNRALIHVITNLQLMLIRHRCWTIWRKHWGRYFLILHNNQQPRHSVVSNALQIRCSTYNRRRLCLQACRTCGCHCSQDSYCWLLSSRWFYVWLILRRWRLRRRVPPKRRLTFNSLYSVISQKTKLFITTALRISNLTRFI
jgi:hypothetical protein